MQYSRCGNWDSEKVSDHLAGKHKLQLPQLFGFSDLLAEIPSFTAGNTVSH